jgi:hypothetical protein
MQESNHGDDRRLLVVGRWRPGPRTSTTPPHHRPARDPDCDSPNEDGTGPRRTGWESWDPDWPGACAAVGLDPARPLEAWVDTPRRRAGAVADARLTSAVAPAGRMEAWPRLGDAGLAVDALRVHQASERPVGQGRGCRRMATWVGPSGTRASWGSITSKPKRV